MFSGDPFKSVSSDAPHRGTGTGRSLGHMGCTSVSLQEAAMPARDAWLRERRRALQWLAFGAGGLTLFGCGGGEGDHLEPTRAIGFSADGPSILRVTFQVHLTERVVREDNAWATKPIDLNTSVEAPLELLPGESFVRSEGQDHYSQSFLHLRTVNTTDPAQVQPLLSLFGVSFADRGPLVMPIRDFESAQVYRRAPSGPGGNPPTRYFLFERSVQYFQRDGTTTNLSVGLMLVDDETPVSAEEVRRPWTSAEVLSFLTSFRNRTISQPGKPATFSYQNVGPDHVINPVFYGTVRLTDIIEQC
jgi:hypothetical protein